MPAGPIRRTQLGTESVERGEQESPIAILQCWRGAWVGQDVADLVELVVVAGKRIGERGEGFV